MISTADLHWAAGFLEGEGSFWNSQKRKGKYFRSPHIGAAQVQKWPLEKLQSLFGSTVRLRSGKGKQQPYWVWAISGSRAVAIAMTLLPLLSPKRIDQIRRNIAEWKKSPVAGKYRERCLKGHAYDLTFSTPHQRRGCSKCRNEANRRWKLRQKEAR